MQRAYRTPRTRNQKADAARPLWIKSTEVAVLIIFGLMMGRLGWNVGLQIVRLNAWWMVLPSILCGYLAADFFSGLVHWFGDSFYREDTPLIGTLLIKNFREHHRDPLGIVRHGFIEVNANNCIGIILSMLFEVWILPDAAGYISLLVRGSLISYGLALFGTNQFHKWAHAEHVPAVAAWLQRNRLILSPEHHRLHHSGRYDRSYCTTTGWMNLVLDRIQFFQRIEWGVRSLTRLVIPSWSGSRRA